MPEVGEVPSEIIKDQAKQFDRNSQTIDSDKSKKISRRTFLKGLGIGTVALPLTIKALETGMYYGISNGFESSTILDQAIEKANEISETPENKNPTFRPMVEIIEEAVQNYKHKEERTVAYKRSKDYKDKSYYSEKIKKIPFSSILPRRPTNALREIVSQAMPKEAFYAYVSSDSRYGQFADIFSSGSGFHNRLKARHPNLYDSNGRIRNYDEYFDTLKKIGKIEIMDVMSHIAELRKKEGRLLSTSNILEYYLEKNNGDLTASIFDTSIILKFMARNNPETGDSEPGKHNEEWYQQNFIDEFQGPSFQNPPKGNRVINLIGKPYHSWNLVALLQFFPLEMIQASGVYRQITTFKDQGLGKTRADLQTLTDMSEIEQTLLKYS